MRTISIATRPHAKGDESLQQTSPAQVYCSSFLLE